MFGRLIDAHCVRTTVYLGVGTRFVASAMGCGVYCAKIMKIIWVKYQKIEEKIIPLHDKLFDRHTCRWQLIEKQYIIYYD